MQRNLFHLRSILNEATDEPVGQIIDAPPEFNGFALLDDVNQILWRRFRNDKGETEIIAAMHYDAVPYFVIKTKEGKS
jgi:hypothetical protein